MNATSFFFASVVVLLSMVRTALSATSVVDMVETMLLPGDQRKGMERIATQRVRRPGKCDHWNGGRGFGHHAAEVVAVVEERCGCDKGCRTAADTAVRASGGGRDKKLSIAAVRGAIVRGGYGCRALLVLLGKNGKNWKFDTHRHRAVDKLCDFDPATWAIKRNQSLDNNSTKDAQATTRRTVVVGVQHNGLGNMLFQLAMARLLAEGFGGAAFASQRITKEEGPMDTRGWPPHTLGAYADLQALLGESPADKAYTIAGGLDVSGAEAAGGWCDPLYPIKSEFFTHNASRDAVTVLIAERPADLRRQPLAGSLGRVAKYAHWGLESEDDEPSTSSADGGEKTKQGSSGTLCVRTIGYFQDYALLAGMRPVLDDAITRPVLSACTRLTASRQSRRHEVVVHVRLCSAPYHSYAYYDYSNYFKHVVPRALQAAGGDRPAYVTVVSSCDPRRPGAVKELVSHFNATVAPKRSAVEDFCYLATAKHLVVTESTFGWWGAYLAVPNAREVHFPGDGAMPLPYDLDTSKVRFHDVRKGRFHGRADEEGKLKYELTATGHANATSAVKKKPKRWR